MDANTVRGTTYLTRTIPIEEVHRRTRVSIDLKSSPDAFPGNLPGCIRALVLRSHQVKLPRVYGNDRCDRIPFRSDQRA